MTGAGEPSVAVPRLDLVPCPQAPAGRADPTRRWAVRFPDGLRLPGLTRPEAERAIPWLAGLEPTFRDDALVAIDLPAILAEGAGPYLLDARGRIVLAIADHPHLPGARVAMGQPADVRPIGLVRPAPGGRANGWVWSVRAEVGQERTVPALDALDALVDQAAVPAWSAAWTRPDATGAGSFA